MSKLARACAVAVAVATSLAGGIAAAQIQGGAARKTAPPAIALGVPVTKATISQRSSSSSTSGSGSSLSFESGQPALRYQPIDLPTAKDPVRREAVKDGAKEAHVSARGGAAGTPSTASTTSEFAPAPGVLRANMPPVSFADAQSVLKTRVLPANVNQGVTAMPSAPKAGKTSTSTSTTTSFAKISGDAAASGPASIAELARALRNHPDLIYQYVRNNVEYYPTFGLQKGALGAVLDNQATAHDQAALMVELLRASGFEANYVRGIAKLSAAQLAEWWGVSTANACGVLSLLGQAQIPVYQINATAAGSCPGTTAALTDVSIEHVWVKTRINGSWYVFDPSYKPHTFKSGIDLASASTTGYDAAAYQSSAQSGATVGTDYVQNLRLTKNTDGTYKYELLNRAVLKFNAAGKAETYTEPSGVQAKFTYSGNDLTQVQNSLGRTLTFTNSSGRISKVSDGTRSVSYGYDASSNLATFTNTLGQATTFSYAQPGQIRSIYNPSFPGTATLTNTYDTLGRVKNQVNARGKSYDYYFAGSRTEEVGPGGVARTSYLDGQGNVIQSSTPAGHWTTHTYDGQSRLIRKQLPEGNATEYAYDDAPCAGAEPNTTTGPRFRYTGQQLIGDLGLYHYKARFYSPGLGRFLQTDPIGYKDDVNLYAYVGNNPANRTDPSGLIAREAVELAAGVGGAISDGWSASVAAFQNESLGDMALKTLEGLNPTVGAAAGAGVRLLGASRSAASFSHLVPGGGLAAHEAAGGHLLARHLGQTQADLAARLASQPSLSAASAFANRAEAEAAISGVLDARAADVNAWVAAGAQGRLVVDAAFNSGYVLQRGAAGAVPGTGVRAVLEGTGSGAWRIITGYPTP